MTRAAFPGTFDPLTLGHESLARRAALVFDEVLMCVAAGVHKRALFTLDERVEMARESFSEVKNIRVLPFDDLLVAALRREKCRIILRGMRAVSDFEFESQMSQVNKALGGAVEKFVSPHVAVRLRAKIAEGAAEAR